MKQITTKLNAGSANTTGFSANARPTHKFAPNLAAAKKDKEKTDPTINNPSTSSNNDASSTNQTNLINGNKSRMPRGGGANYRGGQSRGNFMQMESIFQGNHQIPIAPTTSASAARISSTKRESSASNSKVPNTKKTWTSKNYIDW